ncbi:MAG: DNA polymerase III subunit chi [Rhodospirillales bacterium]|nr:DNA polymerase III subunit chi [Rhodospirillales bacterium]
MTEIRFYHLTVKALDQVLPEILTKALSTGRRAVVKTVDERQAETLNAHLWTWRPDAFLPHGSAKDGFAADQPVWITTIDENPNKSDILILAGGVVSDQVGAFDLCCEMLDGNDAAAVKAARVRWKDYKEAGYGLTYWQQTDTGGWEKKA